MVDQPHVKDQAHSTFASVLFQNIMADILPSLNVFPGEAPTAEATPLLEGIHEGIASGREEAAEGGSAESGAAAESTAAESAAAETSAAETSAAAESSAARSADSAGR